MTRSFEDIIKNTNNNESGSENTAGYSSNKKSKSFGDIIKSSPSSSYNPSNDVFRFAVDVTEEEANRKTKKLNNPLDYALYGLEKGAQGAAQSIKGIGDMAFQAVDNPLSTVVSAGKLAYKLTNPNSAASRVTFTKNGNTQSLEDMFLDKETSIAKTADDHIGLDAIGNAVGLDTSKLKTGFDDIMQKAIDQSVRYDESNLNFAQQLYGNVAQGIGGMVPSIATGMVAGPNAGLALMATGAAGNSTEEALSDGANVSDALSYGIASGAVEVATEKMFGGVPVFGEGWFDDVAKPWIDKTIKSKAGRALMSYAQNALGEGFEEYVSEVAGEYLTDLYKAYDGDKNAIERFIEVQPDAMYSALVGALTGAAMSGPGAVYNLAHPDTNTTTQSTLDEADNQTQTDVNLVNKSNVAAEQVSPIKADGTSKTANEMIQEMNENVGKINAEQFSNEAKENTTDGNYSLDKALKSSDPIIKMEAQRRNAETIKKSAKKYQVSEQIADKISEVSNGLGVQVEFVDTLENGAEGMYENGKVYISKNTTNPVHEVFKHELTHHLETTDSYARFQQVMYKLAEKQGYDIAKLKENTKEIYAKNGIELDETKLESEVTAILTQNKIFNDQGTINDLAQLDISVAQKILRWIQEKIFSFSEKSEARAMMLKAERLYRNAIKEAQNQSVQQSSAKYMASKLPNPYSYESLISQPDIPLLSFTSQRLTTVSKPDIVKIAKKNALNVGAKSYNGNTFSIKNNGEEIIINRSGLLHTKTGKYTNERLNAIVNTGELLKTAVKVNEAYRDGKNSSIYFNEYIQDGNQYVIRFVVLDGVLSNASLSQLYSLSNKKVARLQGQSPFGATAISIDDLLRDVNSINDFKNSLPLNVIYQFNSNYKMTNRDLEGVKYSAGTNTDELSGRKKDLMAVHNINEDNLVKSLELGGLAYPSIAVTKDSIGHDEFGDISLVFNKNTIDPQKNSNNKVYSRDAWTPTFPTVETKINQEEAFKVRNDLKELSGSVDNYFKNDVNRFLNEYVTENASAKNIDNLVEDAKKNFGLKATFLEENGEHVVPELETKDERLNYSQEELQRMTNAITDYYDLGADVETMNSRHIMDEFGIEPLKQMLIDRLVEQGKTVEEAKEIVNKYPKFKFSAALSSIKRMMNVFSDDYVAEQTYNENKIQQSVDEKIDPVAYEEWVREKFSGIFGEKGIRNDKELYTKQGNRRTFEQLHEPYDLDNVVDYMKNQTQTGKVAFGSGLNTMIAARANEFSDIDSIIQSENLLETKSDELNTSLAEMDKVYDSLRTEAKSMYRYPQTDAWSYFEEFANASVEAAKTAEPTVSSVKKAFKQYDFNVSDEYANKIIDLIANEDKLTTDYFEAKPQRAVGFDEIKAALIPNNLSEKTKQMLREKGINTLEYDPTIEGDRQRLLNSLEEEKFSIGLNADSLTSPIAQATSELEKRIEKTFLFNVHSDPRPMWELTAQLEQELNENGKISATTRNKIFNAAYSETVRTADVEYRDNLDFKMMLKDDLNKAISNYEHTVRREQELNQYALENDIPVETVRLNSKINFLKNVKSDDLPDKVISYKRLKSNLKRDLIGEVENYDGGKGIDTLIDKAAIEILNDGIITSKTKYAIFKEMMNNGFSLDTSMLDDNPALYDDLKSMKLNVPRSISNNLANYQDIKKILKTSTKEGTSIEQAYQELHSQYGDIFPEDITHPADQLSQIANVLQGLEPLKLMLKDNPNYNAEMQQFLKDSFADKMEDFRNQVLYRSQKSYYDSAAKKQVDSDNALDTISSHLSEKFLETNQDVEDLLNSADVIKNTVSSDDLSMIATHINNYGALSKTLSQNLDSMANGDIMVRQKLEDIFEKPLREAKKSYVFNQKEILDDVYNRITQELGIKMGSKEASAIMWYGEGKRDVRSVQKFDKASQKLKNRLSNGKTQTDGTKIEYQKYTLTDLKKEFEDSWQNIVEADKIMRKYYDDYVDRINDALKSIYTENSLRESVAQRKTELLKEIREAQEKLDVYKKEQAENGMTPDNEAIINAQKKNIQNLSRQFNNVEADIYRNKRLMKRKDYYHHFQEIGIVDSLKNVLEGNNLNNISNALSGISENTKPKAKWASFMQKRSNVSRYESDAIKAFLKYAPAAEYKIAFDPYIARLRGVIQDLVKVSDLAGVNNSKAINWLTNYTNSLAGKTNPLDRWLANTNSGRDFWLPVISKLNSLVKGNAVVANLNSAVSQFYNLPNGIGILTDKGGLKAQIDIAKGSKAYMDYAAKKTLGQDVSDSPINQSVFLAERFMDSTVDQFDERIAHKPEQAATFLLTFGDQVVAEQLWFSAYEQGQRLGKKDAISYADDLVARAVGGRGVGEVPLTQQSKLVSLIAPFQVEVNNAWNLIKQMSGGALKDKELNKALGLLMIFGTTWVMNKINQCITGNSTGFDLFGAIEDAIKNWDEDKNLVANSFTAAGRVTGEAISNMPMGAQLVELLGMDDYQKEAIFGEADPSRYGIGNLGLQALIDPFAQLASGDNVEWQDLVTNYITPFGGKQINRMYKMAEDSGIIPRIDFNINDGFVVNGHASWGDDRSKLSVGKQLADTKVGAYNDKGNLKYQIDTDDYWNMMRGFMFGTYATDQGKEYLNNNWSSFSEKKTGTYETIVNRGADPLKAYYGLRNASASRNATDKSGSAIENSKAALNRKAIEDAGIWNIVSSLIAEGKCKASDFGLNAKIMEMSKNDYQRILDKIK